VLRAQKEEDGEQDDATPLVRSSQTAVGTDPRTEEAPEERTPSEKGQEEKVEVRDAPPEPDAPHEVATPKRHDAAVARALDSNGNDLVQHAGAWYNSRGYRVCGVRNVRHALCGRIGVCPFHMGKGGAKKGASPEKTNAEAPGIIDLETLNALEKQGGDEKPRYKRSWTNDEHMRFLEGIRLYGRGKWKKVSQVVGTRSAAQCQSHAQKYFIRQNMDENQRKKRSIHDICELREGEKMIKVTDQETGRLDQVGGERDKLGDGRMQPMYAPVVLPYNSLLAGPANLRNLVASLDQGQERSGVTRPVSSGQLANPISAMVGNSPSAHTGATNDDGLPTQGFPENESLAMPLSMGVQPTPSDLVGPLRRAEYATPVGSGAKMRITVFRNGENKHAKALIVPDTMEELFARAAKKFGMPSVSRIFTREGGEIDYIEELMPDDAVWLSGGEDFVRPPRDD